MLLDVRFRGHDGGETTDFFCELLGQDTRISSTFSSNQLDGIRHGFQHDCDPAIVCRAAVDFLIH